MFPPICRSVATAYLVVHKKILPLQSLAFHNWIGEVPWQLHWLSFAEKMLIAKVRHNRCVIRVASGRGKLSANAIMFASPIVQVYNVLPPSRDEISEVLAFVFIGSNRPSDEDYFRTPMLLVENLYDLVRSN